MNSIDSKENRRFKSWKKLKDKKYRKSTGTLLVEGAVVIEEVMAEGYVKELIVDKEKVDQHRSLIEKAEVEVTLLDHRLFNELVSTETDQGILALCRSFLADAANLPKSGRFLYADGVQDPGNLGGMIRSAEAFHFDGVLVGPGTVDPTNDKCIRASMASAFRLPVAYVTDEKLFAYKERGALFAALDIRGEGMAVEGENKNIVLIVGNEARGIREELLEKVDLRLRIPMKETIDSLNANVAASIAMFVIEGGGQ